MEMKHKPTAGWMIGKKIHAPEAEPMPTIHGIVHVNRPAPPHHYAEIVAMGPGPYIWHGVTLDRAPCSVGDIVMVNAAAGTPEVIEGDEYHWLQTDEIKATVPRPSSVVLVS